MSIILNVKVKHIKLIISHLSSSDEYKIKYNIKQKKLFNNFVNKKPEGVIFSSEISAIVKLGIKCFDLSKFKLLEFLQLQYCSGNRTIYET